MMRLPFIAALTCVQWALANGPVRAQDAALPDQTRTLKGRVVSIGPARRTLTIQSGPVYEDLDVPEEIAGFSSVRIGDRLTLRHYDSVVLMVRKPGDPFRPLDGRLSTVTATIEAIDWETPAITFVGPLKRRETKRVEDRAALSGVQTGDRVDITSTPAVLVSIEPRR